MTERKPLTEIFGLGNPIRAIKQLRDESGASLRDAQAALKDAAFDLEEARRLLKERGQSETPESRKVQITQEIKDLEEHKRFLRERFEEEMAFMDRSIMRARKKLQSIEEQQTRY
jgi:DNA-binding transcriptional MerR regulator